MPTDKNFNALKAELTALEDRLTTLERMKLPQTLGKLEESRDTLVRRLDELSGIGKAAALVVAVLIAITGINTVNYNKYEAVKKEAFEVLIDLFENRIGDTVDRISFLDPSEEQTYRIMAMTSTQKLLRDMEISNTKFELRSRLADVIRVVIESGKEGVAKEQLSSLAIDAAEDRYVLARVLTLQAMMRIRANPQRRDCDDETQSLAKKALSKDPGVGAAYNIVGVCLTNRAAVSIQNGSSLRDSARELQEGIGYYDLASALKPTDWTWSRNFNNKVSAAEQFLVATLGPNRSDSAQMDTALAATYYQTFDNFVSTSLREVGLSQQLGPSHPGHIETEAELHGLRWLYYSGKHDSKAAGDAYTAEKEKFQKAVKAGLYAKQTNYQAIIEGICGDPKTNKQPDPLLSNMCGDREVLAWIRDAVPR